MKKILTSILTLLLSLPVLQAQSDDPQLINITTLEQLNAIRYDLDGNGTPTVAGMAEYTTVFGVVTCMGGCTGYELRNDLDFAGSRWEEGASGGDAVVAGWEPIGIESNEFTAIFEGNRHTISNLFIGRFYTDYVGLFGYVSGNSARLRNIGLLEVKVTGDDYVGGLVGYNSRGTVSGSYATGSVTADSEVGGLVGANDGGGTVSNSYATGSVTGSTDNVGGLLGRNDNGMVSNNYATGAVRGVGNVGGLVGRNDSSVSGSYATGSVTGTIRVGGLVGEGSIGRGISSSYATGSVTGSSDVGGLVGGISGTITASYYNSDTTGQSDVGKGEGKATTDLLAPTGYTGIYVTWDDGPDGMANNDDDTDYWDFGTNGQYPVLKIDVDGNGTSGEPADLLAQRPLLFVLFDADGDGLIEVRTLEQLNAIRYDLDGNGEDTTNEAAYSAAFGARVLVGTITGYELMNNLNFNDSNNDGTANDPSKWAEGCTSSCVTGRQVNSTTGNIGWEPIGTETAPFTGTFDGNDHTISNLYINRQVAGTFYAGLFGYIKGTSLADPATLESLNLRDINVKVDSNRPTLGGLVGLVDTNSNIMLCSVTGTVFASSGSDFAYGGGLVGQNSGNITSCYTTGDVTIASPPSLRGSYGGGLVGRNLGSGSITASYATGDVTYTSAGSYIGGLVGWNQGSITSCYAAGDVTTTAYGGGLVGWNTGSITASYATGDVSSSTTATRNGGGLVGRNQATITNSYYNDGATITGGGNTDGTQTKSALQTPTAAGTGIYQTWGDVWDFGTNIQYPALKVDFDGDGNATVTEFGPQRSAKFKSPTYYFYVNPDAVVTAVVGTVRASVVRDVYGLGYSILSQKIGEDATTTSGFAFAITDKDEDGIKVGELTVATALIPVELYTLSIQVDDDNGGMDLTEVRIEVVPERLAAPTHLTATAVSATQINLTWEAPSDGGSTITGYDLEYSEDGNVPWMNLATSSTMTSFDHTGLTRGTTRHYRVAAINSVGTGEYSATTNATTTAATLMVLGTPTNLTATAVSATQINLSWDAPSEDGGDAITDYDLEFSEDGNKPWTDLTTSGTTTSFDDTGLTAGSTRHYRVAAVNSIGTGNYTTTTDATTTAATLTVSAAPTNLTATSVSDTQIDLSWDAPSEDGGDAITGYDLEYSEDGNEPWTDLTTSGTTTSFDDTGLTAGSTRHYRVAAINNVGTGDYSEEASATVGSAVLLSVPLEVEDGPGVYPNPGSDKVYVNLPNGNGAYVVRLHTLAGKVVLQKQLQGGGTRTLSLSKLQDGVYILNVQKDGQSSSYRLIKATH